ncbi:sigma-54-dependent transcriptional regulator [Anaeromyxobacter paludicola]|uniref:Acetoacetate metabolism regulatory protein AtoC n=1 Tax=Anaeromyxobacter paludicola TaxID=2918171 RepID=A0ABM7XFJ4_9BACT|nr:sigma-54 dependent transcriptional regulator [Anaeromyxobacter paludicola]BDG10679.1 acetoacetate metabolism regulatory protein AtoC [Anaeromyxobacter paludicola]
MSGRGRVLVVDDKENMLKLFSKMLGDDYDVTTAGDGTRALALLAAQRFDVVVTDLRMPGADGFAVLRAVKDRAPDTEVVMMTAHATVPDAVEAMRQGAWDYLQKPFDPDQAGEVVAKALARKREREAAQAPETGEVGGYGGLVGRSAAMREVYRLLAQAASLDITVLLGGETGTGKELAARAIHFQSARREKRFVPVNCGALPAELVESELFGHARGAFTGAAAAKAGLFEEAEGGTLFLDEVGELPLPAQVKLNRALQEKEIRRVGESTPVKVDVRVIAATHRDLGAEVKAGRFREDLYYRLHVFPVELPALRARKEDLPLLAAAFLDKYARAFRREVTGFTPAALAALAGHAWPGNVRELENAVERAVAVTAGPEIRPEDLPPAVTRAPQGLPPGEALSGLPYREALDQARDQFSREYLVALMKEFGGNVTRAAERAGVERESLHRLLKRHGLRSRDFEGP